ncbi:hypothetical protein SAMN05192575_10313 [Nocardioides alpinus]|uniref:Uncharacterized protein n=1 Tax=Nocardioides alpinus TaxID=748909 RepID=A0A1I0XV12_9ACTN|nr:hypothetical protein [Nocardioides alpinus]PKH42857.1 hypothetical protein CXG46_06280 [Nocardioides alpinus]SFB04497.1 hypothetical protein SAMN05192575_10313 [Nocardioides alpinus]
MSAEPTTDPEHQGEFLVRPDGTVRGDDGASGALAAALPYTGRLARRMGELVEAGDLRVMEAFGAQRLTVGVTWTPAGEGTFRAVVTPLEPRALPSFMVVGGADTAATVSHCVNRLAAVEGVAWSSIVTADSRVIAAVGEQQDLHHLAEVGNRMLAILRSLEDQHATGFMRLRFEKGAVIGASLGRHALVAFASTAEDTDLVTMIDEIRAILADHDLGTVTTEFEPGSEEPDEPVVDATPDPAAPARPALPVGARYRGAAARPDKPPRRSLFGR